MISEFYGSRACFARKMDLGEGRDKLSELARSAPSFGTSVRQARP